jgi:hypothetical protein
MKSLPPNTFAVLTGHVIYGRMTYWLKDVENRPKPVLKLV